MSTSGRIAAEQLEQAVKVVAAMRAQVARAMVGQAAVVEQTLAALLAGGHVLIEGVPGLGKTLRSADLLVRADRADALTAELLARREAVVMRGDRRVDVRSHVIGGDAVIGEAAERLCAALDWPAGPLARVEMYVGSDGAAKPSEVAAALGAPGALVARAGLFADGRGDPLAIVSRPRPAKPAELAAEAR